MARINLQMLPLAQVTVNTAQADTLASLLSLTTDDECLAEEITIQADTGNTADVYLGGVNSSGVADASSTKCFKLTAAQGISIAADDALGDEDRCVADLRQISVRAGVAGQKVNVLLLKKTATSYNS